MAENEKKVEQAAQAKKDKKSEKKPGIFARIGKWFRDMKSELKKVQWPTKKQTINNTVIVIVCVVVVGVAIALFDFVAGEVIGLLIGAFKG
ncbi:MAG: preprotein translocase subunit SecE [Lawsonibacter sp.]|nr:preprotein translocase subunit SecE [Lawsonibacter sp.]